MAIHHRNNIPKINCDNNSAYSGFGNVVMRGLVIFIIALMATSPVSAQLSFCQGVGGPPIFNEDFGQGTANGPPLAPGITNYTYASNSPEDGFYTLTNNMQRVITASHNTGDHTGNADGKALVVNADFTPGIFYQTSVSGLCENTTYEFSAWLLNIYDPGSNICPSPIPINVRFEIWDATNTRLLSGGGTGNIRETATPQWQKAGLSFTTEVGQGNVILKMINNGVGGCGNDLAIDDIQFRTCGDDTAITTADDDTSATFCLSDGMRSETLNATVQNSVYSSPVYQWEVSGDGENFTDIIGETKTSYTTPLVNSTNYYRARIAEDVVNLYNSSCNNYTSIFALRFADDPPVPTGQDTDLVVCDGVAIMLKAQTAQIYTIDWYDSPTGGNLLSENSNSFEVNSGGFYYAEARLAAGGCISPGRAEFRVREGTSPLVRDESITKCAEEQITLESTASAESYLWSTGEKTPNIQVSDPGIYIVTLTGVLGCTSVRTITVANTVAPVIEKITRDGNFITVYATGNPGLRFSLDGINYQISNMFELPEDPVGTVYVQDENGCTTVQEDYRFIIIPDYFTPNGDGYHDIWTIRGLRVYNKVKLSIFDRFGKLLKQVPTNPYEWDGIYRGTPLQSSTYWYLLEIDGKTLRGNILLKR